MSSISDANSILELAFGTNAAFTILLTRFRTTKDAMATQVADQIAARVSEFHLDDGERDAFRDFVFKSMLGLRIAYRFSIVSVLIAIAMTMLAILGLVVSALAPEYEVETRPLVAFTVLALVVCPGLYLFQGWLLDWFQGQYRVRSHMTPTMAHELVNAFRLVQGASALFDETDALLARSKLVLLGIRFGVWREDISVRIDLWKIEAASLARRVMRIPAKVWRALVLRK